MSLRRLIEISLWINVVFAIAIPFVSEVRPKSVNRPSAAYELVYFGAILVLALVALFLHMTEDRYQRRLRRKAYGQCPDCGYCLAGNISGVCPECGTQLSIPENAGTQGIADIQRKNKIG